MNLNQIVNMIVGIVTRRLVNFGINKGVDLAARRGKPKGEMTAADREQSQSARETVKRARQAARITRRLGR